MAKLRNFFGCIFMPVKCQCVNLDFEFDMRDSLQDVKTGYAEDAFAGHLPIGFEPADRQMDSRFDISGDSRRFVLVTTDMPEELPG